MNTLFERCAGIDVHKEFVQVCARVVRENGESEELIRRFSTMTAGLLDLAAWLEALGVTHVAMESTGVYWKPVNNVLRERFSVIVCNAQHLSRVPGRKTDIKDCQWIAQLLQCGLLQGSFLPPRPLQELRDLTRLRASLVEDLTRVKNRLLKVLEDANIKMSCVASDAFGKSGRAIIEALIEGVKDAAWLAELAKGRLRSKKKMLALALEGRVNDHHRLMLRLEYQHVLELEKRIHAVESHIAQYVEREDLNAPATEENPAVPFGTALELIESIPGVNRIVAITLLAETGTNMRQFPTPGHLAAWAGLCPGNNESAGKNKNGKTRKGNPWVRRAITQAGWAASHAKKTFLSAKYHRIARRRGKKRALIATARTLLQLVHEMLTDGNFYEEIGPDYYERQRAEQLTKYLVRRLTDLGHDVTLSPAA